MTAAGARVRALSIHASYRCRRTGVCCSSGWDIPVEAAAEDGLRAALRARAVRPTGERPTARLSIEPVLRPVSGLPHGARVVLGRDDAGRCLFLERDSGLCAVHRRLGEEALPTACRQFPRVVTLTPLGVSVTLSHYCPTAAALLFSEEPLLRVVDDPPAFPTTWPWEGLDARDALPPLLRPGVLMSWPSLERWERFAVSVLAGDGPAPPARRGPSPAPEEALDVLAAAAEEARRWTPEEGPFEAFFEGVRGRATYLGAERVRSAFPGALRDGLRSPWDSASRESRGWHLVAECVPNRDLLPAAPEGLDGADARWVAPVWPDFAGPIRRWLAARAFASWLVLQGEGLRTAVLGLRIALSVLRAEAARGCAGAGRALDAEVLREAIRRSDLLLVHLADPAALARRLGRAEWAGPVGVAW